MKKILFGLLLATVSTSAFAQRDKANTWEWSFAVLYQESKSMSSQNGSSLNISDEWGFGFNIGYNWTNNFAVSVDLDFLRPDYSAVLVDDMVTPPDVTVIDHEFSQFNGRIKGTYRFLEGPFRPFVEAGIGWTYFDSNVTDGPPIIGCWWHPWWGYICDGFYNTFTETTFTYGAGLGFQYQFPGDSFLKASYNVWQLDGIGVAGDDNLSGGRIEYGWNF